MKRKILIIGLDGAEPSILYPLAKKGKLPTISRLMNSGIYGTIESTVPILTPTAWETSVTGVNPGRHNMFDFIRYEGNSYSPRPTSSLDHQQKRIWEYLGDYGKRVCILNYPMGFPPDKVNGIFVSGRGIPSLRRCFTYPKELRKKILIKFPDFQEDINKKYYFRNQPVAFLNAAYLDIEVKGKLAFWLLKKANWDLFMVFFMTLDRVQHFFFNQEKIVEAFYVKIDEIIGKLLEKIKLKETNIILYSDHGMGPILKRINLNHFLRDLGYASFKRYNFSKDDFCLDLKRLRKMGFFQKEENNESDLNKKYFLSDEVAKRYNWNRTRAYVSSVASQSLRINLRGREKFGIVKRSEYQKTKDELIDNLYKLKDGGKKVIKKIYRKEEIFSGPYLRNSDDIFIIPQREYFLSKDLPGEPIKAVGDDPFERRAEHLENGILICVGDGFKRRTEIEAAKMVDIFPTILNFFRIPIPNYIEGRPVNLPGLRTVGTLAPPSELNKKINKSTKIIKKAIENFASKDIAIAWTGGKDSTVLLHMVREIYKNKKKIPFKVFFNDSTMEFEEIYEFVKRLKKEWNLDLIVVKPTKKELSDFNQAKNEAKRMKISRMMKISAIKRGLKKYKFKAFLVGIRWDEHSSRAKETYFSPRKDHTRVHPLLHFTEVDVWQYINNFRVPYVELYDLGYRSLGEKPFTERVPRGGTERDGRERKKEILMDRLRALGYW